MSCEKAGGLCARCLCCCVVLSEVGEDKDVVGYVFGVDGLCLYVFNGVRCGIWVFFGKWTITLVFLLGRSHSSFRISNIKYLNMQADGSVLVEMKDANGTVLGSTVIARENAAKVTVVC